MIISSKRLNKFVWPIKEVILLLVWVKLKENNEDYSTFLHDPKTGATPLMHNLTELTEYQIGVITHLFIYQSPTL